MACGGSGGSIVNRFGSVAVRGILLMAVALTVLAAPGFAQERKPGPLGPPSGPYREQEFFIAWERAGRTWLSHAKIFRPTADGAHPLVLIAHGSPRNAQDRQRRSAT